MRSQVAKKTVAALLMTAVVVGGPMTGLASGGDDQQTAQRPQPQRGRGQGGAPTAAPGVPVQELQSMFDAYTLVQAQKVLQLDDERYQQFFTRMTRLQELRRQHTRQRMRLLNDLRRMAGPQGAADEATLTSSIQALDALDEKFAVDLRAAHAAIDATLTVRQRAAFRFFEEEMDRQKIEFLTRARQAGRG
jgi:hypothetical protein